MFVLAAVNGNPKGLIIIGVIVGVIVVAVALYYMARAMKGSMKLVLAQKAVSSGQQITGSLSVTTKKAITADRLYIALIGEREERRRDKDGDTRRRWVEFFRDEADVLLDQHLPAGFSETYEFSLDAPSQEQVMTGAEAIVNAANGIKNDAAKAIVKGIGTVAAATGNMMGGRKRWKVAGRLETKGVDLAASEKIHVSLKSAA